VWNKIPTFPARTINGLGSAQVEVNPEFLFEEFPRKSGYTSRDCNFSERKH
jgi:hypothetical protein